MLSWSAPGQLSYDSVTQLADGRSGHYDSWHPPVMAWLLGLFDRILPGTFLFLMFTSGLALAALLGLLWLKPRPGWGVAATALLIVLTPQWLLFQSDIWKDVLFADAALAGFAALAMAAADWPRRWPKLVCSACLLSLAAMTRQNGLVLLPIAGVTLGFVAARYAARKAALLYGASFFLVLCGLTFGLNAVLLARGDGGAGAALELRYVQGYDLAGALARNPSLQLPVLKRSDAVLETLLRTRGASRYSARQLDSFMDDPPIADAIEQAPAGAIFAQWRDLVIGHPWLYLTTRWPVFWQVLATPDLSACHPIYVGVDGDPGVMKALGIARRWNGRDAALAHYAGAFTGSPLFSHLAFAGLAAVLLVWLLRRGGAADLAMAGLMAGALAFALTFLIVSVACDYRYLYVLDISALAGALYAARGFTRP